PVAKEPRCILRREPGRRGGSHRGEERLRARALASFPGRGRVRRGPPRLGVVARSFLEKAAKERASFVGELHLLSPSVKSPAKLERRADMPRSVRGVRGLERERERDALPDRVLDARRAGKERRERGRRVGARDQHVAGAKEDLPREPLEREPAAKLE